MGGCGRVWGYDGAGRRDDMTEEMVEGGRSKHGKQEMIGRW